MSLFGYVERYVQNNLTMGDVQQAWNALTPDEKERLLQAIQKEDATRIGQIILSQVVEIRRGRARDMTEQYRQRGSVPIDVIKFLTRES